MKKLPPDEIKTIAAKIKADYAYMDQLPFDGWMWEMIRRKRKYLKRVGACKEARKSFAGPSKYRFMRSWKKKFVAIGLDVLFAHGQHCDDEYHIVEFRKTPYLALPFPEKKYTEFTIKPAIFGSRLVQYLEHSAIKTWKESAKGGIGSVNELIQMLSPVRQRDTLYLGISRIGKKKEILKEVSRILDEHATFLKNRRRTDKWKYYLIVYDLAKTSKLEYNAITEILGEAFPDEKNFFDIGNIRKYHNIARRLINHSEYLEHLPV